MIEHPILFSGAMVRAILEGQKTQTRRVIKPQIPEGYSWTKYLTNLGYPASKDHLWAGFIHKDSASPIFFKCPYGRPSDRLWVRETWRDPSDSRDKFFVKYRATDDTTSRLHPWRPSIFMPRWASRITLMITDVRCERLQDISEKDAKAEGCEPIGSENNRERYRSGYMHLWNKINGKTHPWDSNPWVWVISFKRIDEKTESDNRVVSMNEKFLSSTSINKAGFDGWD